MVRGLVRALLLLFVIGLIGAGVATWYIRRHGLSARAEPSALETAVARRLRHLSIPADERARPNRLAATAENVDQGMEHFADHCAICHANTGAGDTPLGRRLYPHPPILREATTQSLTDGELFSIIQNGIRFTGMPAFADSGHTEDDSWKCVLFIRHLPQQTPQEVALMEKLNPKAPDEDEPKRAAAPAAAPAPPHTHTHKHGKG